MMFDLSVFYSSFSVVRVNIITCGEDLHTIVRRNRKIGEWRNFFFEGFFITGQNNCLQEVLM